MSADSHPLPACQKCRTRKVRCDRKAPKCGNCMKGNVACIIVDQATGEQYARDYIRLLEEQEERLRKQFEQGGVPLARRSSADDAGTDLEKNHAGPPTGGSTESHGGFVGDGSGLGFLHSILSQSRWQHHRARILSQLAVRPRILQHQLAPNDLPPLQEAEDLLENYFTRFHIHHTFLLRNEVLTVFNRIYSTSPMPQPPAATAQDHFRLLMVFAISATTRFRAGLSSEHPYGYFMAAEEYLNRIPLVKDIEAIENLLLVARFGMYHHIGTSLWEISQVCMRQCVELQLHTKVSRPLPPLVEQHQRRIFWECYVLDRYSSGILGRPFAIAEEEIGVPLPIDMYDDHIADSGAIALDQIPAPQSPMFTEISIFISFILLRRISSRIHSTFYTGRKATPTEGFRSHDLQSVGKTYVAFSQFNKELAQWRVTVPTFSNPRSLYERSEWHDFMWYKDMLLLTRGAMHSLPSNSPLTSSVIKEILQGCYTSASQVIYLYEDLMNKRAITWTRSYFQVIFTAGLTVTYCLNMRLMSEDNASGMTIQQEATEILNSCSRILTYFKEKMPDAGSFAVVFDLLRSEAAGDRMNRHNPVADNDAQEAIPSMYTTQIPYPTDVQQEDALQASNYLPVQQPQQMEDLDLSNFDFNFNLTEDLMTQLEAGIGEYAWGSLQSDGNFWDQFPLA